MDSATKVVSRYRCRVNLHAMLHAQSPRRMHTDNYAKTVKKVEMLFAHLKRILKLKRLGLRGLSGANDEFLLVGDACHAERPEDFLL